MMIERKQWAKYTKAEIETMRLAVVAAPPDTPFPPEYAAAYVGKSSSTLQYMRSHCSDGITYCKIGGHVRYLKKDLDAYLEKCRQSCPG